MKLRFSKNAFLDYFAILLILLASKSSYSLYAPTFFVGLFFVFSLIYKEFHQHSFKLNSSLKFIVALYILYIFNSFYYNSFRLTFFIYPLGTFLIISNISLNSFRTKLFNLVFLLALSSIIAYFAMIFNIITPTTTTVSNQSSLWHFYGFNFISPDNWYFKHRNSGIYHEPGAFQIILNFALLFSLTSKSSFQQISHYRTKFVIILIALVLTKSTNAYISTMLILLYSFKENIARNKHLFIPMILLSIALIYYVVTSEIILDKISNRDSENSSFFIRANDNFACLRMFAENPLLGVGNGSLYESLSSKYGNVTASNGILAELARLGIFWGILYFSYFFKGINKITQYKKSFMFFFAFICILVLANEDMMGYPIAYIMTLQFKSYLDVGNEKNSYIPESTNSAQKIN